MKLFTKEKKELSKKDIAKKVLKIIGDVLICLFVAFCIFGVTVTVMAKKDDDGTATIFGRQMRIVTSNSMEKCDATDVSQYEIKDLPVKTAVFIETVPENEAEADQWYAELKVGDVLTFKYVYTKQETITHRITSIEPKLGSTGEKAGYIIRLAGDNKDSDGETLEQVIDTSVDSFNYVIGKVTGQSYVLGLFIYALSQPVGLICIVIIPCALMVIWELFRIFSVLKDGKNKEQELAAEQQKTELEELKRKLAELEDKSESDCENGDNS